MHIVRAVLRARGGGGMSGVPIPEAAQVLDVAEITLRRWIAQGCPVARRGGRGRGHSTLVIPEAVKAWRDGGAVGACRHDISGLLADAALAVIARYSPATRTGAESRLLREAVSAMAQEVNNAMRK